jgi:hypothetical protein
VSIELVESTRVTSIQYELKSSSYGFSCIECMAVTPAGEVIVILQMAVIEKLCNCKSEWNKFT